MKQFLLTKKRDLKLDWIQIYILEYCLYCHPEMKLTREKYKAKELLLLGSLYDWEVPEKSNKEILSELIKTNTFEMCLNEIGRAHV